MFQRSGVNLAGIIPRVWIIVDVVDSDGHNSSFWDSVLPGMMTSARGVRPVGRRDCADVGLL